MKCISLILWTLGVLLMFWIGFLSVLTGCATTLGPKRPPCTWQLYSVQGTMVRTQDNQKVSCQGEGAVECVGLTKSDLENLVTCGGN